MLVLIMTLLLHIIGSPVDACITSTTFFLQVAMFTLAKTFVDKMESIIDLGKSGDLLFHINKAHESGDPWTVDWMLSGLHLHSSSLLLPRRTYSLISVFSMSLSVLSLTFPNSVAIEKNILKCILIWNFLLDNTLLESYPTNSVFFLTPNTTNPSRASERFANLIKTTHF